MGASLAVSALPFGKYLYKLHLTSQIHCLNSLNPGAACHLVNCKGLGSGLFHQPSSKPNCSLQTLAACIIASGLVYPPLQACRARCKRGPLSLTEFASAKSTPYFAKLFLNADRALSYAISLSLWAWPFLPDVCLVQKARAWARTFCSGCYVH